MGGHHTLCYYSSTSTVAVLSNATEPPTELSTETACPQLPPQNFPFQSSLFNSNVNTLPPWDLRPFQSPPFKCQYPPTPRPCSLSSPHCLIPMSIPSHPGTFALSSPHCLIPMSIPSHPKTLPNF